MSIDIQIEAVIRALRGESKAHLASADDGHLYVVKSVGNPQGTRSLWNEWVANQLFGRFGICVPRMAVVRVRSELTTQCAPGARVSSSIPAGLHLGSRLPVNPNELAIWDFLPAKLFARLTNRIDFAKALVVDCLLGKTDHRQAIFTRHRDGFVAHFIDHGGVFSGASWQWDNMRRDFLHFDRRIYDPLTLLDVVAETLIAVQNLSSTTIREVAIEAPSIWLGSTPPEEVEILLSTILDRKQRLGAFLENALSGMIPAKSA